MNPAGRRGEPANGGGAPGTAGASLLDKVSLSGELTVKEVENGQRTVCPE